MCLKRIINCLKNTKSKNAKLAIIILGDAETGKSTLLKELVNKHSTNNDGNNLQRASKGTRRLFFNNDKSLTQDAYIIFSSLSEDNEFENDDKLILKDFIDKDSKKPFNDIKVLIYPDHPDTNIYKRNKEFLKSLNFKITEFKISHINELEHWRYNKNGLVDKDVKERAEDIIKCVMKYSRDKLK